MTVMAGGLGGVVVGRIEGDPGGVRSVAQSWRSGAGRLGEAVGLSSGARGGVPSWQGEAAVAFAGTASSLESGLEQGVGHLSHGAGVLDDYAAVLESAIHAAAALREQAGRVLLEAMANPLGAGAAVGALSAIAGAWANLQAEVDMAAARTAAILNTGTAPGAGAGGQKSGDKSGSQTSGSGGGDLKTSKLNPDDIERIKRQDESGEDWSAVDQQGIGDCFLLATLQAYSNTEKGRQRLRDQIQWNKDKQVFVVTFYYDGMPVPIEVDDYYTDGAQGKDNPPTLMSIYERAYGIYISDHNLDKGGYSGNVMHDISKAPVETINTSEPSGFLWLGRTEDHKYEDSEWSDIEQASEDNNKVVTASTDEGGVVHGTADTNGDGAINSQDSSGNYRVVKDHVYTVVTVDDNYVTLYNPWAHNDGEGNPGGGGLIRVSRSDYGRWFTSTDIGNIP